MRTYGENYNAYTLWYSIDADDNVINYNNLLWPEYPSKVLFTITKEPSSSSYEYIVETTYFMGYNYRDKLLNHVKDNILTQTGYQYSDFELLNDLYEPSASNGTILTVGPLWTFDSYIYTYYNQKANFFTKTNSLAPSSDPNYYIFLKKKMNKTKKILLVYYVHLVVNYYPIQMILTNYSGENSYAAVFEDGEFKCYATVELEEAKNNS